MTTPDIYRDAEYITDVFTTPSGASEYDFGQDVRVKKVQATAKVALIDRVLRDLDILIYCELSALYYMDCSISLFLLRAIIQLIFFTPKAAPFDPTRNQPYIGAIFTSNIICMIFHAFFTQPEIDETTRGYLHGGLFIDFIGQKGPVSVARLILFDLLIMMVDFVMLGLVIERVRTVDSTSESQSQSEETVAEAEAERQQDHDLEERGVLRGQNREDVIELDELARDEHTPPPTRSHNLNNTTDDDERTNLLAEPSSNAHTKPTHPLDIFSSGEYMLMDFGLIDIIRNQWRYSPSSMSSGRLPTTSSSRIPRTSRYAPSAETAAFLRERFGLQVSANGRVERIES